MNNQEPRETPEWVEDAKAEIIGMGKEGISHPSTKPVLLGAGIGAVAGALIRRRSDPWRAGRRGDRAVSEDQEVTS